VHIKAVLPSAITSLRVAALPFVLFSLNNGNTVLFLALFLFSVLTDLADGYIARKLMTTSNAGAYYDTTADFGLIAGIFVVFTLQGVYPWWILAIIVVSFALFIITSLSRTHIYDPIGRYWGSLLYATIAATAVIETEAFSLLAQLVIVGFFAASLASRIAWFFGEH
jgi:phosphatidylglycerophosphate synthase